jgi:hypothetical protein
MTNMEAQQRTLRQLLISAVAGEADAKQWDELSSILQESEEARDYVVAMLDQMSSLEWIAQKTTANIEEKHVSPSESGGTHWMKGRATRFIGLILSGALAASLLLGGLYAWYHPTFKAVELARIGDRDTSGKSTIADQSVSSHIADRTAIADQSAKDADRSDSAESVGTVVQQRDCKWAEGSTSWRNGDILRPKTLLSLQSGAAEVALENGVRLVLSGPCEVQLVSEMRGRVFRGSLVAKVPAGAHGYTLTTPSSQVVDLGTEFGVAVDRSGTSEVHVFTGEVVSRWNGADKGQGKSLRLHQNDGARYGLKKSETTLITADETRFIRDLAPRLLLVDLPPLPVRKNLALWLAADRMIETDATGGVQSWSDLLCDPSQTFQVALQLDPNARPRLIPDAINGRPAVRFDGVDDSLVTTPLETTDSQTIFVVLGLNNMRPTQGQIINYNGPPHRELSAFPTIPGVLHLSARRFSGGGFRLAGFVYPGGHNADLAVGSHVRTTLLAGSAELKVPIVVSFRYDPAANSAALHVNGKMVAQKTAPWPIGLTSRKVIGSHGAKDGLNLNADIAEIVIYNQALSDSDMKSVFSYLANRYGDSSKKGGGKAE